MRSDLDATSLRDSIGDPERFEVYEETPIAKRGSGAKARRANIVAQILVDATQGAREYVERWKAGRGAE